MIRFLLRSIGLMLLALAFIFVVYDGMRSIADRAFAVTPLDQFWSEIHSSSLKAAQATVDTWVGETTWQFAVLPVLHQPAAAIFAVIGALFILLGRKKRPLIGYARD